MMYHKFNEVLMVDHVKKLPLLIAFNHVDLTGNPDAACKYLTASSIRSRSYALLHKSVSFCVVFIPISDSSSSEYNVACLPIDDFDVLFGEDDFAPIVAKSSKANKGAGEF